MKSIINRIKKIRETHLVPDSMFNDLQCLIELHLMYFKVNNSYKYELECKKRYYDFRQFYIEKYKKLPTVYQINEVCKKSYIIKEIISCPSLFSS